MDHGRWSFNRPEAERLMKTALIVAAGAFVGSALSQLTKMPQSDTTAIMIVVLKAIQYYIQPTQ